ncbi:MAG: NirA family protein [Armatimonadetes bacterium]|nr:NirA family protein [Armatimonadota bacterium]
MTDGPIVNEQPFTEEQKQYLQGFAAGAQLWKADRVPGGSPVGFASPSTPGTPPEPPTELPPPDFPEAIHRRAQDRFLAEGKKLVPEELEKRKKHPLDRWDDIKALAEQGAFPKGTEVFAWKFHGMFYVAPAQDSFMCRLRFYGGLVRSDQMRAVADLAERYGGGYADITTRANLQIREIRPENTANVLTGLLDAGIVNRGAGADNVRNITGSPTAGIDPQELYDVRPLCRELHYTILNHRELYGLPRKFNIAFDGGGAVSNLEDTNDIGFSAVRVAEGKGVPAGVYFRMSLGGITGHLDFARDTGLLLQPEECIPVALAVLRVFIEEGDRTDRKKARLKYVLDRMGIAAFTEAALKLVPFAPLRFPLDECEARGPVVKDGHIGVHPQRQDGLYYVGVVVPVGRMNAEGMREIARIAGRYGSGTIRLTVWQNLLISDISETDLPAVQSELSEAGFHWSASPVRRGLIACTGNGGCKFSASDTKGHALEIGAYLEDRVPLDQAVNIHLTGCPHSCAQHYIGDIGLLGTKVEVGDDMVEGYHLFVGGGYGDDQNLAREIQRGIPAEETPAVLEHLLLAYLEHRRDAEETFLEFTQRHSTEELSALFDARSPSLVTV